MKIVNATCTALNIPFYCKRVTAAMQRANTHAERVYFYRVETDNGLVGYGDSEGGANVEHLIGLNPYAIMNDDSIGFGAQVAVLDVVGKDAGVPVHALLGTKIRNRCPISWWDIDMPPADWAAEAKESIKRGHTCFKMKARPWRDIHVQIEAVGKVVPPDYKFDIDFNGFLLTAANAEVHLQRLDDHPNVGMYESPFYLQQDLVGAKMLRQRVRKPVIEHFNEGVLHAHAADGFVVGGGATSIRNAGTLAASFNKPFWLQLVGSGLTTTFAAHIGSVLSHARLPYITCHELWKTNLLTKRIEVVDGYMPVPDGPGLGVEVDEKAVEKYSVPDDEPIPRNVYRSRKRILRVVWPGAGGRKRVREFTDEGYYQTAFYDGSIPGFEPNVTLEVIEDDRSAAFRRRHAKILESQA